MVSARRTPDSLRPNDLKRVGVWEFTNDEISHADELSLRPVAQLPVRDLRNRLAATRVRLADGTQTWALLSNVVLEDARATQHFLTASIWCGDRWFPLARYHDVGYDQSGPAQLAQALGKPLSSVFPIAYDLSAVAIGASAALTNSIQATPTERLSRSEIIRLAVQLG